MVVFSLCLLHKVLVHQILAEEAFVDQTELIIPVYVAVDIQVHAVTVLETFSLIIIQANTASNTEANVIQTHAKMEALVYFVYVLLFVVSVHLLTPGIDVKQKNKARVRNV